MFPDIPNFISTARSRFSSEASLPSLCPEDLNKALLRYSKSGAEDKLAETLALIERVLKESPPDTREELREIIFEKEDAHGHTALQFRYFANDSNIFFRLLELGADPWHSGAVRSPAQLSLEDANFLLHYRMIAHSKLPDQLANKKFDLLTERHHQASYIDLATEVAQHSRSVGAPDLTVAKTSKAIIANGGDLYDVYLFLRSIDTLFYRTGLPEKAFITALPKLFYQFPASLPSTITNHIRSYTGQIDTHHPNLAEVMTLLDHPQRTTRSTGDLASAIYSLSSTRIPHFQSDKDFPVFLEAIGRIGSIGHSFSRLRFDSERVYGMGQEVESPSLLERYGFERLPARETDRCDDGKQLYGTGYCLNPGTRAFRFYRWEEQEEGSDPELRWIDFSDDAYVELRRAYALISTPDDGTLIIRNSSPVFGRSSMTYPAYYSDKVLGVEKLQALSPEMIDQYFHPVPSSKIGGLGPDSVSTRGFNQRVRLASLVEQLDGVFDDYSAWIFDTRGMTAWDRSHPEGTQLLGAYHSQGFSHLVRFLEQRASQIEFDQLVDGKSSKVLPSLQFVHRYYPPWSPYPFETHQSTNQLSITPEVLRALRLAVDQQIDDQTLEKSGLRNFFQTGLNNEAVLMMRDPSR